MRKTELYKIDIDNILDIMYNPKKNRYSILEYNGTRKQISREGFLSVLKIFRRRELNG